jgi:hypothetical protein
MTEAKWLACEDPEPLLKYLRSHPEKRKWRLFAGACCRRTWRMLDDGMRVRVEDIERRAEARESDLSDLRKLSLVTSCTSPHAQKYVPEAWLASIISADTIAAFDLEPQGSSSKSKCRPICSVISSIIPFVGRHP